MGIIKAAVSAVGGTLADQWLESIEPENMDGTTIMTKGSSARRDDKRNRNNKGSEGVITSGSVIHVGEKQFMMLVDGGKVIDYTAEPGYFEVRNENAPSLFSGSFGEALCDAYQRVRFGGVTPFSQQVVYINTQEVRDIPFGTQNPINYFDAFYNAELYLRAHGYYSIHVVNPLLFYSEVARGKDRVAVDDLRNIFLSEFLTALQTAIGKMSVDGVRISHVASKSTELAQYMAAVLDEDWTRRRGMFVESVGISSISYDEQSKKLIDVRNQGAMLSDPSIREGYVQGSVARGIEAAGSNKAGSMQGFMGVGMGMQSGGNFMASASSSNQEQIQNQQQAQADAAKNTGDWNCTACGSASIGKFCSNCGAKRPESLFCSDCGNKTNPGDQFCSGCGKKL